MPVLAGLGGPFVLDVAHEYNNRFKIVPQKDGTVKYVPLPLHKVPASSIRYVKTHPLGNDIT